jgi:2-polyprenyl-6-methoxyphenol hydroxylase-like FAD-dependent oxidoreductase
MANPEKKTAKRPALKAVIVGGSISGLMLANIFERVGIEYILLEAYPDVAYDHAASIGIWGGGARVLDQVGCFDTLAGMAEPAINSIASYVNGKRVMDFKQTRPHSIKRQV